MGDTTNTQRWKTKGNISRERQRGTETERERERVRDHQILKHCEAKTYCDRQNKRLKEGERERERERARERGRKKERERMTGKNLDECSRAQITNYTFLSL